MADISLRKLVHHAVQGLNRFEDFPAPYSFQYGYEIDRYYLTIRFRTAVVFTQSHISEKNRMNENKFVNYCLSHLIISGVAKMKETTQKHNLVKH